MSFIIAAFLSFFAKEWRYILILISVAGLYIVIYNRGYNKCENAVKLATLEAERNEQSKSVMALKTIQDDNIKQKIVNQQLQEQLNAELQKPRYGNCVLTNDGVRIINKFGK